MIVDTSALLAILFEEDDAEKLVRHIGISPHRRMSSVNLCEGGIVADANPNKSKRTTFDELIGALEITVEPVAEHHAMLARDAYRRFGKGNHPARLNLGDCFAYALAKVMGEPLLFKGDDFTQTDVERVL